MHQLMDCLSSKLLRKTAHSTSSCSAAMF